RRPMTPHPASFVGHPLPGERAALDPPGRKLCWHPWIPAPPWERVVFNLELLPSSGGHLCPLPRGEGGPRPALLPAGADRVRGHSTRRPSFGVVPSAVDCRPCASQPSESANYGATRPRLKGRHGT